MFVGMKMLGLDQFVTINPDTPVAECEKLMVDNHLWMLLVVKNGKLVGHVRKEDVLEALPSRATTLSRHELNYLLTKLTAEKILRKDVPTISAAEEIEKAAHRMHAEDLPGLAVVDRKQTLLGFINRGVMLDVLVEEMGLEQGGSRIVFDVMDRVGVIKEVSGIISDMDISIIATGTFFHENRRIVVFRVKTDDPAPIETKLKELGYRMVRPEDFQEEWT